MIMDIEYIDKEIFVVSSVCYHGFHWSVHPVRGRGWDKRSCIVILASSDFNFIRVHENLVQHPSNNISIVIIHPKRKFKKNFAFVDTVFLFVYPKKYQTKVRPYKYCDFL